MYESLLLEKGIAVKIASKQLGSFYRANCDLCSVEVCELVMPCLVRVGKGSLFIHSAIAIIMFMKLIPLRESYEHNFPPTLGGGLLPCTLYTHTIGDLLSQQIG